MSGEGRGKGRGAAKPAGGNRAKSGKPRPGTGGYGRRKLEGKGPTPGRRGPAWPSGPAKVSRRRGSGARQGRRPRR